MSGRSRPVTTELPERLRAVARDVADAESALSNRREQRRRLVVQALDEGMAYRSIADLLGGSVGLVSKIAATPEPEEE